VLSLCWCWFFGLNDLILHGLILHSVMRYSTRHGAVEYSICGLIMPQSHVTRDAISTLPLFLSSMPYSSLDVVINSANRFLRFDGSWYRWCNPSRPDDETSFPANTTSFLSSFDATLLSSSSCCRTVFVVLFLLLMALVLLLSSLDQWFLYYSCRLAFLHYDLMSYKKASPSCRHWYKSYAVPLCDLHFFRKNAGLLLLATRRVSSSCATQLAISYSLALLSIRPCCYLLSCQAKDRRVISWESHTQAQPQQQH